MKDVLAKNKDGVESFKHIVLCDVFKFRSATYSARLISHTNIVFEQ